MPTIEPSFASIQWVAGRAPQFMLELAELKEVLNRAIRSALGPRVKNISVAPIFPAAFPSDSTSFNHLADAWDDEETLRELSS